MEIPLYNRSATGGFHPLPRPSFEAASADRSGERAFLKTVSGIAGDLFGEIIQAQVANEYHSFIGAASEREQQFFNLIRQKPDMPIEDMLTERDNMIKDIRLYHAKLKLPKSRQAGANWIASNVGTLKERAEGEIGNVSTRYSQQLLKQYRDVYIQNMKPEELTDLYERHIAAGTIPEKLGRLQLELDIDEINKLRAEQFNSAVLDTAVNIKNKDEEIDLAEGDKFIESQKIPAEDKISLKGKLRTAVKQEEDNNRRAWEEFQGKEDVALQKFLDTSDYTGGLEYLESIDSGLKGKYLTDQIKWKDEKKKLFEGGLSGKENYDNQITIDELKQDAFKVYLGDIKREDYAKKVNDAFYVDHKITTQTKDELFAKMDNPLSPAQASAVRNKVNEAKQIILASSDAGVGVLSGETAIATFMASMSKENKQELADRLKWVQMYDRELTEWVLKNEGDVGKKFEEKAADLQARYVNASYDEIQAKIKAKEEKAELHPEREYKVGDTRTIDGTTYTFNGTVWKY